jgi:hypothetical protein
VPNWRGNLNSDDGNAGAKPCFTLLTSVIDFAPFCGSSRASVSAQETFVSSSARLRERATSCGGAQERQGRGGAAWWLVNFGVVSVREPSADGFIASAVVPQGFGC